MNPIDYKPKAPEDFIGEAKDLALILERIAVRAVKRGGPVKLMIRGNPGIGKTALLKTFLEQIGVSKWSLTKINGADLTVEKINEWTRGLCFAELYGNYRALWIEEVDKVSSVVQVRMLTLLDDLPDHTAIVCTSNKDLSAFDPRFHSRFQVFCPKPPGDDEVKWLLKKFGLRSEAINRIATFAAGNVRLALFDAQSALDELAATKGRS